MKISIQSFNNQNNYSPGFKAIPLAKYSFLKVQEKDIVVYKLEKSDTGFLKYVSEHIDAFYKRHEIEDESPRQIVKEAVDAGIEILQRPEEEKSDILLAMADFEPSAILIGNILKKDKNGNVHYSSRKNHSKKETELDWLATWNKKILGEGKVIVTEFFHRVLSHGFKQVYVRSEVPEKSFALEFYKKMGFEPLSKEQRKLQRKNDNSYVIGNYDVSDDMVIPMKATIKDIKTVLRKRSREFEKKKKKNPLSTDIHPENM